MESIKREKPIWPDNTIYFLTDSTFLHYPYFRTEDQKQIVLNQIIKLKQQLEIPILDYSIAINHYHLKLYLARGNDLSAVKQLLRGGISYEYRKKYNVPYKEIWQSGKIIRITSEQMNWRVSGYIIGNLLKHKEVSTFNELKNNKFSSFWHKSKIFGEKEMIDLVYQTINIEEDALGGTDIKQLNKIDILKITKI